MKKWLAACLLAIALLFVATTAMAGHTKVERRLLRRRVPMTSAKRVQKISILL